MKFAVTTVIEVDPEVWALEYGLDSDPAAIEADVRSSFTQDVVDHLNQTHAFGPNATIVSVALGPVIDEYEMVTEWGRVTFDQPVPLVPRAKVQKGDIVHSSHGYKGVVVDTFTSGTGAGTTTLTLLIGEPGDGMTRGESYPGDSTIPVLRFVTETAGAQA